LVNRKRKRNWGDWHHRVPDFELVYCGPKKNNKLKKEKIRKQIISSSKNKENLRLKEKIEQNLQ
jgi:hypothetical protein